MRPSGAVIGIRPKPQTNSQSGFAPNAPPLCQRCWTIRHRAGSFISRLVFRPGALLKCADCGVTIFDDRPKGEKLLDELDDKGTEKALGIMERSLPPSRRLPGGA